MYTIQYTDVSGQSRMQTFDSRNRHSLITHLAQFSRPILAVYEQTSVITKAVRRDLAEWPGSKSAAALDFIKNPL